MLFFTWRTVHWRWIVMVTFLTLELRKTDNLALLASGLFRFLPHRLVRVDCPPEDEVPVMVIPERWGQLTSRVCQVSHWESWRTSHGGTDCDGWSSSSRRSWCCRPWCWGRGGWPASGRISGPGWASSWDWRLSPVRRNLSNIQHLIPSPRWWAGHRSWSPRGCSWTSWECPSASRSWVGLDRSLSSWLTMGITTSQRPHGHKISYYTGTSCCCFSSAQQLRALSTIQTDTESHIAQTNGGRDLVCSSYPPYWVFIRCEPVLSSDPHNMWLIVISE